MFVNQHSEDRGIDSLTKYYFLGCCCNFKLNTTAGSSLGISNLFWTSKFKHRTLLIFVITSFLSLFCFYRPEKFDGLLQRLRFLEANKLASSKLKSANQLLATLWANVQKVVGYDYQLNKRRLIGMLVDSKSLRPMSCCNSESGLSACWLPFDIYMENEMDGRQLPVRSAIVILSGTSTWREVILNFFFFNILCFFPFFGMCVSMVFFFCICLIFCFFTLFLKEVCSKAKGIDNVIMLMFYCRNN